MDNYDEELKSLFKQSLDSVEKDMKVTRFIGFATVLPGMILLILGSIIKNRLETLGDFLVVIALLVTIIGAAVCAFRLLGNSIILSFVEMEAKAILREN